MFDDMEARNPSPATQRYFRIPGPAPSNRARVPKSLLDAQDLVPFRHALGSGERADLELLYAPSDREMHDRDVLGLARTRRDDRAPARLACRVERRPGFRHRPRLIRLDQDGVARPAPQRAPAQRWSPENRRPRSARGRQRPAVKRRIPSRSSSRADPRSTRSDSGRASSINISAMPSESSSRAVERQPIAPVLVEFRCGNVERDRDLLTWGEARALDRAHERVECRLVRIEGGPEPPSSATPCSSPASAIIAPAADTPPPSTRAPGRRARTRRHDHEVLDVDPSSGMSAATEYLNFRQRDHRFGGRQQIGMSGRPEAAAACRMAIETATSALPPSRAFLRRSVELDQFSVDRRLIGGVSPVSAGAISPSIAATAPRTSAPPSLAPPSRRSIASPEPVDAPAGAIARPTAPPASLNSASTVGRPRESQTRRPAHPRRCESPSRTPCPAPPRPRAPPRDGHWISSSARATRRTRALSSSRTSHTRRATCRRPEPATVPAIASRRGLRSHPAPPMSHRRDSPAPDARTGEKSRGRTPVPQALEEQVIETEGEIERRIAVPGAFGVEKHRTARPDEDVLRTDIAVHQRQPGSAVRRRRPSLGEFWMRPDGGDQIGLDADRVKPSSVAKPRAIQDRPQSRRG